MIRSPDKGIIMRLVSASLMIIVGTAIYVIFRRDIVFLSWMPDHIIANARGNISYDNSIIAYFVVYCLPDGLWYGALLLFQSVCLKDTLSSKIIFVISMALPYAWELMQISDSVPGTFDPMDLLAYIITLTVFLLFSKSQ